MMRARNLLVYLGLLALPGIAAAQTRIYGTLTCAQTTEQRSAPIPGKPGHVLAILRQICTWPQPVQMAGTAAKDAQETLQSDIEGPKAQDTGTIAVHMVNVDEVTFRLTGASIVDAKGAPRNLNGTWTLTDGTGMLKGITGKGTYSGFPRAAGGFTYDIEGQYQIPTEIPPPPQPKPTPPSQPTPPQQPSNKS